MIHAFTTYQLLQLLAVAFIVGGLCGACFMAFITYTSEK